MGDVTSLNKGHNRKYTLETKVQPESLLPILRTWKLIDPEKYGTMVAMICSSAGVEVETLLRKSRKNGKK